MVTNKITILSSCEDFATPQKTTFRLMHPHYGNATITLDANADYFIRATSSTATENAIKRMDTFKRAIVDVTNLMIDAFTKNTEQYTLIKTKVVKPQKKSKYENEVTMLSPKKYSKRSYSVHAPTMNEVMAMLSIEADNYFHGKEHSHTDKEKYIRSKCEIIFSDRYKAWEDAKALFNEIESAHALKLDTQYQSDYENERNAKLDFINGDETLVKSALNNLSSQMSLPFFASLSTSYSQSNSRITADLCIDRPIEIPDKKAVALSSGKISIKSKTKTELDQELTDTIIGVAYYVASHLFNVSPNVAFVDLSITDKINRVRYFTVSFERDLFITNTRNHRYYNPEIDIFNYETDLSLRSVRGASVINYYDL